MASELFDVAFSIATKIDPSGTGDFDREFVVARERLARIFVDTPAEALEDAFRKARHLTVAACEVTELHRGPKNDGTGLPLESVEEILRERCHGFSQAVYQSAITNGFYMTK
jgi:hypothetical protein